MDVRPHDELPFPCRPVVDLHPRVELLRVGAGQRMPLAASNPVVVAAPFKAAQRQRSVLEPEMHEARRQALENPRKVDFDRRIGVPQREGASACHSNTALSFSGWRIVTSGRKDGRRSPRPLQGAGN